MKLTYDPTADALALQLTGGKGRRVTTKEVLPGVHLDIDEKGRLVALELLCASHHVPAADLAKVGAPSHPLTLDELEQEFGLAATTWRKLLERERIAGVKIGTTWTIERAAAVNYMETRDPRGRQPMKRKARRTKARA